MEEEHEHHRLVLREVFGESSSSSSSSGSEDDGSGERSRSLNLGVHLMSEYRNPSWEQVAEINGLWLCRVFLSPDQQSSLISSIQTEGWFSEASHNQAMRFSDLPAWAIKLSDSIRELVHHSDFVSELNLGSCEADKDAYLLPSDLLWRNPLFDQMIINRYQPGEGICAHVDLMRFDDGIAIISLESSCIMHFSKAEEETSKTIGALRGGKDDLFEKQKVPIYLPPGSLVFMWGEARYLWKHEINRKPGFQIWKGRELQQMRRTSVTLRKLCQSE